MHVLCMRVCTINTHVRKRAFTRVGLRVGIIVCVRSGSVGEAEDGMVVAALPSLPQSASDMEQQLCDDAHCVVTHLRLYEYAHTHVRMRTGTCVVHGYMCTHACVCVCVHGTGVRACVRRWACLRVWCMCAHMSACAHGACMHACMHAYMHVCVCACVRARLCLV